MGTMMNPTSTCLVRVLKDHSVIELHVPIGANLRRALLDAGISPYTTVTRHVNCGGRGLCATCGVRIESGDPGPRQWHDALAARFRYPRLSCQITVTGSLTVRLVTEKWVWGSREHELS